jgi:hypothetical protein
MAQGERVRGGRCVYLRLLSWYPFAMKDEAFSNAQGLIRLLYREAVTDNSRR